MSRYEGAQGTINIHRPQAIGAVKLIQDKLAKVLGEADSSLYPTFTKGEKDALKEAHELVSQITLPYNEHKNTEQLKKLSSL